MTYEYEHDILELLKDIERERSLDLSKEIDEIQGTYQTARLIDNIVTTTKKRLSDQERKAKAYDLLREDLLINEKVFREQAKNDEVSDIIHGHYVALLVQAELERADDENQSI